MERNFELRMTGQVLVLLPEERRSPLEVPCLVVGGRHRPMLALPMGTDRLETEQPLPSEACVFLDARGEQYVMIDITGYALSIGPKGKGVTLGHLEHLIDMQLFLKGAIDRKRLSLGGVAASATLTSGTLEELGIACRGKGWKDEKDEPRFDREISGVLRWNLGILKECPIVLRNGITEYELILGADSYSGNEPVVMFMTALCGWNGSEQKYVDFDEVHYVLPDLKDQEEIPDDIEYYEDLVQPKTGGCPPKILTIK